MSDRELLEMAAKALDDPKLFANTTGAPWQYWIGFCEEMQCDVTRLWNPLDDDGDAFRLAQKLHFGTAFNWPWMKWRVSFVDPNGRCEHWVEHPDLKRAIVSLAALIS